MGGLDGVQAESCACGRGSNNVFHEFTIRRSGVASSLFLSIPIVRLRRVIFCKKSAGTKVIFMPVRATPGAVGYILKSTPHEGVKTLTVQ